jgi:hypothetical protein
LEAIRSDGEREELGTVKRVHRIEKNNPTRAYPYRDLFYFDVAGVTIYFN